MNPTDLIVNPEYLTGGITIIAGGGHIQEHVCILATTKQMDALEENILKKAFEKYCKENLIEEDGEE